jgi:hypothetical protein
MGAYGDGRSTPSEFRTPRANYLLPKREFLHYEFKCLVRQCCMQGDPDWGITEIHFRDGNLMQTVQLLPQINLSWEADIQ